jgi:hypothetical protein
MNVIKVDTIKSKDKEGKLTENGLHILTFESRTPKEEIKIGYMKYEIRTWYPGPMKCIKCMQFGHSRARCNSMVEICRICSKTKHEGNCEQKCLQCFPPENKHMNFDSKCPTMIHEKVICKLKIDKNISFVAARKEMQENKKQTYTSTLTNSLNRNEVINETIEVDHMIERVQKELEE